MDVGYLRERAGRHGGAILVLVAGVLAAFHPTILSGFAWIGANEWDTRFNNYVLEHGWRSVSGTGRAPFWDPPLFHPVPNTAAFSDVLLGSAPLYWLARIVGLPPDTAFQVWHQAIAVLDFVAAYAFLRVSLGCRSIAAAAGGFVFAFAGVRTAQLGHAQLFPHFWFVGAVFALERVFAGAGGDRAPLLVFAAALSVVAQVYAGFYLGWFTLLAGGLALAGALATPAWRRAVLALVRERWIALAVSALAAGLLLWPLVAHSRLAASRVAPRAYLMEVAPSLPRPSSWLYSGTWLYGWQERSSWFRVSNPHEQKLGLGFATSAIALAGVVLGRRRPIVQLLAGVGFGLVLVTTDFGGRSAWSLIFASVPGASALRAVSRVGLVLLLPAAVTVGVAVEETHRRGRRLLAGALLLVVLAEQVRTIDGYDKHAVRERVAALARRVGPGASPFLVVPPPGDGRSFDDYWWAWTRTQLDAMWVALETGRPTLNGYSGNDPLDWPFTASFFFRQRLTGDDSIGQACRWWGRRYRLDPATIEVIPQDR